MPFFSSLTTFDAAKVQQKSDTRKFFSIFFTFARYFASFCGKSTMSKIFFAVFSVLGGTMGFHWCRGVSVSLFKNHVVALWHSWHSLVFVCISAVYIV